MQARGGKGIRAMALSAKTGELVALRMVRQDMDLLLISDDGTVIRMPVADVSVQGRSPPGVRLMRLGEGAKVVALARERYDYVIIDSPPLGFFSDSELLSDLSDASVLVVRQDTVPAPEINDAIDALRAGKAEFLGCILNDMAHLAAWSSGYGYGYGKKYDKYGYGQHSARKTQ